MNALWNAPISDCFSSLCARVFSPVAAILESEKTLGTRLFLRLPRRLQVTWERGRICAWQKLAGLKFSSQGRIMLHRRALSKFLLRSKYRGNLMYMIYLTLLWLNFRITGHWNIPQQSTQDCYRGPRSAVQWSEASKCSVHVITSFFNPY